MVLVEVWPNALIREILFLRYTTYAIYSQLFAFAAGFVCL